MGLGGVISNLLSLGAHLIPVLTASSSHVESHQIETELKKLMRLLEWIKATLYDAEQREIRDFLVKLWLKELRRVACDAEDVLDEYRYEDLRAQVEARSASPPNSLKRKLAQVSDGMLHQIQQIRSNFAEIEKYRLALRLSEEDGPKRCNSDLQSAPTSHFVVHSDIIGREREKEKLISILCTENYDGRIISVVTIVGTGGIGKTTLAKLVYNDQRIQEKFDKVGWVCVSDDFNVQRLTREIVESITGRSCGLTNLSALQDCIRKEIRGKQVFFVLDDVWNDNRSLWDSFQTPFVSASLVKILATTRNTPVAQIMQTESTFNLSYMSEERSWQMFQHYAFGGVVQNMGSNLVEIGKQIMRKCGMLPLAVKSIACLLRHEPKEESWREILESELWESNVGNEIFQPLQISYTRLPTYLKPCFLYCSMFPRYYKYSADELVKLWISQGYVQTSGLKSAEEIGWEYVKQLHHRSFFEGIYCEKFNFTLHDMIHDLARFNSRRACYFIEGDMIPNFPEELFHLHVHNWENHVEPPSPWKFTTLRSFIMEFDWVKNVLGAFDFSEAKKLRVLQLELRDVDLASHFSFAELKHLRYLSLHKSHFQRLPEFICSLYNLQYLTLHSCHKLKELPKNIGNLVSLEELKIIGSGHLRVFPVSLCQLKALRKLDIVESSRLEELPLDMGNLVSLEELTITECGPLRVLPVSICQLKSLRKLFLCGFDELEELPHDMGNLVGLEELAIIICGQLKMLPISLCQLKALRKLNLDLCSRLEELPSDIGHLVSLEELTITECCLLSVLPESICQLKTLNVVSSVCCLSPFVN